MGEPLFSLDGYQFGDVREEIVERRLGNAWASFVPGFSAATMFYTGVGNCLIDIGEFTKVTGGLVGIETTRNGGKSWQFRDCAKIGRAMKTSVTATGPAKFRVALDDEQRPSGLRVLCKRLKPMEPIRVTLTFAGTSFTHYIRTEPDYVIQEEP